MCRFLKGLYLVVDPTVPQVVEKVEKALRGGVDILQLWSPPKRSEQVKHLADELLQLAEAYEMPLLINNDLDLAKAVGAHGVHIDGTANPEEVRRQLGAKAIVGLTCSNDLQKVLWAEENGADYISFCSVFPTPSVQSCDLVPLDLIRAARKRVEIPIFASGGITLDNLDSVLATGVDGVALISAILNAPDPEAAARSFKERLRAPKVQR